MKNVIVIVLAVAGLVGLVDAKDLVPKNEARVSEIAAMLPEKPGVPGAHISNRAIWDRLFATDRGKNAIGNAETWQAQTIPECSDELYLEFSTPGNGNRTHYEKPFFARENMLKALVLGECLENRGRFIAKICDCLNAICAEKTWCMPAHDRGLKAFKGEIQVVDLGAQSRAFACAFAVDLLRGVLPREVAKHTLAELERRVFAPLRGTWNAKSETEITTGWWFQGRANWTAVCHAGITRTALAVLEGRKDRAAFIEAAERSVAPFLSGFSEDGYCSEGMGYWNYGWGNFLSLTLAVREATGGKVNFCSSAKAKKVMEFGTGALLFGEMAPSFADGGGEMDYHVLQLGHLIWPELPVVAKAISREPLDGSIESSFLLDFGQWDRIPSVAAAEYPIRTEFPYAQMWVLRPGDSGMPFRLGLKGGNNAEFHNHNDVGSYTLFLDGVWMTGDAGGTQYNAKTFSPQRYEIAMLNSYGHPLPVVNGALQSAGAKFAAKVLRTDFNRDRDIIVLDISGAYDNGVAKIKRLDRTFVYDRVHGTVSVSDAVEFDSEGLFSVPIISASKLSKEGAGYVLFGGGTKGRSGKVAKVAVATGGLDYTLAKEMIENEPRTSPFRYAFTLSKPVKAAVVTITFSK